MSEYFSMSIKEGERVKVMVKLTSNQITEKDAALELRVCVRQVRRLKKRYEYNGVAGLVHKGRGKESNRKLHEEERLRIIDLVKTKYDDFGPTLALEKLQEYHQVTCGRETLRTLMMKAGIWRAHKLKQVEIHQMRQRRARVGELVQVDGSPHAWFEDRGEKCSLLVYIDDATGRLMHLEFAACESTMAYFIATEKYILKHGKPLAFYLDKHGVFRVNTTHRGSADVTDSAARTQFGQTMDVLNIELIYANTPQAKGRVERANKTLQDRLVKELRLRNISTIGEANNYLEEFMITYNAKFARTPKDDTDAHRQLTINEKLIEIFVIRTERKISKNLEVHYQNQIYQIITSSPSYRLAGAKVTITKDQQNTIKLIYKNKELPYRIFTVDKPSSVIESKLVNTIVDVLVKKERKVSSWKPPSSHPYKNGTFLLGRP